MNVVPEQLIPWVGLLFVVVASVLYGRNNLSRSERSRITTTQYLGLSLVNLALYLGPLYGVLTARTLARSLAFFALQVSVQVLFGILQDRWLSERPTER